MNGVVHRLTHTERDARGSVLQLVARCGAEGPPLRCSSWPTYVTCPTCLEEPARDAPTD